MSMCVNVCMSKIMRTPIKLGIHAYTMYDEPCQPKSNEKYICYFYIVFQVLKAFLIYKNL